MDVEYELKNLLLLSGGMDSALCLAKYGAALCLGVNYGQPHAIELKFARKIAAQFNSEFFLLQVPFLPRVDDVVFAGRNAVLVALGAAIAQSRGLETVVIGCNFSDAQRFPDCRPDFVRSLDAAMRGAYGIRVAAPLLTMTKSQIATEAKECGLPQTWTCYSPAGDRQCGECYSCKGLGLESNNAKVKDSETYGYCDIMHTSIGAPK